MVKIKRKKRKMMGLISLKSKKRKKKKVSKHNLTASQVPSLSGKKMMSVLQSSEMLIAAKVRLWVFSQKELWMTAEVLRDQRSLTSSMN